MNGRPANSRIRHGAPSCADYGCKREECLQARRDKKKRNRFLRDTGRPGVVSPERSSAHLKKFRQAGLQDNEIMAALGIARTTFYRTMRGEPLTRKSEQKILSVPVPTSLGRIRTTSLVNATGTHRRLQALMWLGWPECELEKRLGAHAGWIYRSLRCSNVKLVLSDGVARLYDELWSVRPESEGVDAGRAEAARLAARGRFWSGPLAWDDDTIDDPHASPQTDALSPVVTQGGNVAARWLMGESVTLSRSDRREVLAYLFEWTTEPPEQIAERLEMTPDAATRAWERVKEKAALEGRRVWRRAYVQRERGLKQNEMGEAA